MGSYPMWGRIFFLVSFFPTAYCYDTAYYIILHYFSIPVTVTITLGSMKLWVAKQNNVLHQIIQLFILLNACVLFTDILNNYISTAHYLFLHYLQCVFVNFCYRFHFFHFISFHLIFCSQVFSYSFPEVFLKQFSQNLFQGFFTGFFRGVFRQFSQTLS